MPNFANKSRLPPLDGGMLTAITRTTATATADSTRSAGKKTTTVGSGSALISKSSNANAAATKLATVRTRSNFLTSISGPIAPAGTNGYDWIVYDSLGRIYIANSDFTSFTLSSSSSVLTTFGQCLAGILRYDSSTNSWYTGAITANRVHRSINGGSSWTELSASSISPTHQFIDFAFTPTKIYALTIRRLLVSTDGGTSWSQVLDTFPPVSARAVLANGTNVAVVGTGVLYGSTDSGTTWTATGALVNSDPILSAGLKDTLWLWSVLYFDGKFWILGNNGSDKTFILTSSNAVTWSLTFLSSYWSPREVVRDPVSGLLVAQVGHPGTTGSGMRWSSNNGITWTNGTGSVVGKLASGTTTIFTSCPSTLKYNGGRYITRMFDNTYHTSADGKDWTVLSTLTPVGGSMVGFGVKYTDPTNQIR